MENNEHAGAALFGYAMLTVVLVAAALFVNVWMIYWGYGFIPKDWNGVIVPTLVGMVINAVAKGVFKLK